MEYRQEAKTLLLRHNHTVVVQHGVTHEVQLKYLAKCPPTCVRTILSTPTWWKPEPDVAKMITMQLDEGVI